MRSARLSARNYPSIKQPIAHVVPSMPLPRGKRALDILVCVVGLPFLVLATVIMVIVTRIVSPGPVFFYQERIGYLGRRFRCYKFRTMFVGADSDAHRTHCENLIHTQGPWTKLDHHGDVRLIPGGRLLRASGLDELPQLVNVLRGEMSLIGPRPCLPFEYEKLQAWHRERFSTLPGLTGLWQISDRRITTFDEMIRLDIHYAQHKSCWLDMKIFVLTVPTLFRQVWTSRNRAAADKSARTARNLKPLGVSADGR
jgi:lipopolysaccharide/colanic/teichoic acid biosynthesis glycosyltransferase